MEVEIKAIEKFWGSLVTENGLASYLLSAFKVSPNDEIKALALLTRVTFLLTVGMKNDRDDSIKNEQHLVHEISKIGENCSSKLCCQKIKLSIDSLLQKFKQPENLSSYAASKSCDMFSKEHTQTDITTSQEKLEEMISNKNKVLPFKILAVETQKMDSDLLKENACVIPETLGIENSQYGNATIFEKTPVKDFASVLEQCNEDFNIRSTRKNNDEILEQEMGNIDDASLSPIVGKKQASQRKSKNAVTSSVNTMFSSPEKKISTGDKLEKCDGLANQNQINFNGDFSLIPVKPISNGCQFQSFSNSPSLLAYNKILSSPGLDTHDEFNKKLNINIVSTNKMAATKNTPGKLIESRTKRSIDFAKSPRHDINQCRNSLVEKVQSNNKFEKHDCGLSPQNKINFNVKLKPTFSKCLTLESKSDSLSLLSCNKIVSPIMMSSPQLGTQNKLFVPNIVSMGNISEKNSSDKVSDSHTNMPKNVTKSTEDNLVCWNTENSSSFSNIICSPSSSPVNVLTPTEQINVEKMPKKNTPSSLRKYKSAFGAVPNSKKTKITPLSKTTSLFRSSKVKSEISFNPSARNDAKKNLRQTTLTQECFLKKKKQKQTVSESTNDSKKELKLIDKNDFILNAAIEESLKTKEAEDMIRKKKEQLMKLSNAEKVHSKTIDIISSSEFEEDMFDCTPVKVTKNVLNNVKDCHLSSSLIRSPRKHQLLANSGENIIQKQTLVPENKFACSKTTSKTNINLKDNSESAILQCQNIELNEEEILAQLEVESQVIDLPLEMNNTFKSKNHDKKEKKLNDSFDVVPGKTEKPLFAYKDSVIRKKSEKLKVDGWECHECKDYFHSKGLSEEQKKLLLNKCSRHRSKYKLVTSTPKGFWNPDWDSINEDNETQFSNCHPKNEPETKKAESSVLFNECGKDSSREDSKKAKNIRKQDHPGTKDNDKKSKRKQHFTDGEFDAIGVLQECKEVRKEKKEKQREIKFTEKEMKSVKKNNTPLKMKSNTSFSECEEDSSIEKRSKIKKKSSAKVVENKSKRKYLFSDSEFESIGVAKESKKMRKEKREQPKEIISDENEGAKEKKGKRQKSIHFSGLNTGTSTVNYKKNKKKIVRNKEREKDETNYSRKDWWQKYI